MLGELCPSRPTQPRDALRRPRGACGDRRSAGGFFLRSSQSVGRTRILRFDLCAVSQLLRFLATAQDIPADLLIEGSFRAERRRIHPLPAFHICGRAINTHRGRIRSRLSACSCLHGSRFTSQPDSWDFLKKRLENKVTVSETKDERF